MTSAFRIAVAVLLVLLSNVVVAQSTLGTASIRGIVVDETNKPVARATIAIGDSAPAQSDAQGRFAIFSVTPGRFVLTARAVGYRVASQTVFVASGQRLEVEMILERITELETANVVGKSAARSEYDDRRARKIGFILDSARLDRPDFVSALTNMPLTRVKRDGFGARINLRDLSGRRTCEPAAFLDGRPALMAVQTSRPPSDFRAIELLPSEQVPIKYQGMPGCGVMLFWSKKLQW